ncbi:MazG nucleotide pyrophosphohydrolase domain-containing protein, partial [Methylophaga sp.]|uniref:MazG nucleotide pyrophosphohydrolase domain-containing protein n=1 Tax=Methylophaga sp. TaxID=2024840 RepID=UPI003F6A2F77
MSEDDFILNQLDSNKKDSLAYAIAMQKKAAEIGFDWPDINGVIDKIHEELEELKLEIRQDSDKSLIQAELGDLLFACCNLARHLDINPDEALNSCNQKFYRRFNYVETRVSAVGK